MVGAATENERRPIVERRCAGTCRDIQLSMSEAGGLLFTSCYSQHTTVGSSYCKMYILMRSKHLFQKVDEDEMNDLRSHAANWCVLRHAYRVQPNVVCDGNNVNEMAAVLRAHDWNTTKLGNSMSTTTTALAAPVALVRYLLCCCCRCRSGVASDVDFLIYATIDTSNTFVAIRCS